MMSMMMSPVLSLPWMQCTSTGKFSGTVNTRRALAMSCLACRVVVRESHHWQCTCHAALQRAGALQHLWDELYRACHAGGSIKPLQSTMLLICQRVCST